MKRWKRDLILSISILIFSFAAIVYSVILESPRIKIFLARPDTYMGLWLGIMALLAVLLLVRALKARKSDETVLPKIWDSTGVFTVVVLFIYLLLINVLGFFLDSFLMLWILVGVYSNSIGDKAKGKALGLIVVKSGVFSLLASYLTTKLFTDILAADLPVFTLF
jgi:hypothetical protein